MCVYSSHMYEEGCMHLLNDSNLLAHRHKLTNVNMHVHKHPCRIAVRKRRFAYFIFEYKRRKSIISFNYNSTILYHLKC